jgi:hypothetical protein
MVSLLGIDSRQVTVCRGYLIGKGLRGRDSQAGEDLSATIETTSEITVQMMFQPGDSLLCCHVYRRTCF